MVSPVGGRLTAVARWYSATFLTLTVGLSVPCRPRSPEASWSFPSRILDYIR